MGPTLTLASYIHAKILLSLLRSKSKFREDSFLCLSYGPNTITHGQPYTYCLIQVLSFKGYYKRLKKTPLNTITSRLKYKISLANTTHFDFGRERWTKNYLKYYTEFHQSGPLSMTVQYRLRTITKYR